MLIEHTELVLNYGYSESSRASPGPGSLALRARAATSAGGGGRCPWPISVRLIFIHIFFVALTDESASTLHVESEVDRLVALDQLVAASGSEDERRLHGLISRCEPIVM